MFPAVISVKVLPLYELHLVYKNGEERILDMKPYLNTGIFKQLKDEKVFNSVKVSFDTIEWMNEIDIDPEIAYEQSRVIN